MMVDPSQFVSRRWRDVAEEEALSPLEFGPLTDTTMVMDVAGTRDLYPIHHDREFARRNGARDIFVNTMWYQGLLGRYVTDWGGPESFLRRLAFQMWSPNCPGDVLVVRGQVNRRRREGDMGLVDLELSIDNQLQRDTVTASATVELV